MIGPRVPIRSIPANTTSRMHALVQKLHDDADDVTCHALICIVSVHSPAGCVFSLHTAHRLRQIDIADPKHQAVLSLLPSSHSHLTSKANCARRNSTTHRPGCTTQRHRLPAFRHTAFVSRDLPADVYQPLCRYPQRQSTRVTTLRDNVFCQRRTSSGKLLCVFSPLTTTSPRAVFRTELTTFAVCRRQYQARTAWKRCNESCTLD